MVGVFVASTLIVGLILLPFDTEGALVMFGITLMDALIVWSVMPKRFEVQSNGLKILLGGPFSMFIPFTDVSLIKQTDKEIGYVYGGIRFTTSSKYILEVERRRDMSVVFSPSRGDDFLKELNRVKDDYREPDFSIFEGIFK